MKQVVSDALQADQSAFTDTTFITVLTAIQRWEEWEPRKEEAVSQDALVRSIIDIAWKGKVLKGKAERGVTRQAFMRVDSITNLLYVLARMGYRLPEKPRSFKAKRPFMETMARRLIDRANEQMLDAGRCPHFNIKNLSRTFWNFYSFGHYDPQLFSLLC